MYSRIYSLIRTEVYLINQLDNFEDVLADTTFEAERRRLKKQIASLKKQIEEIELFVNQQIDYNTISETEVKAIFNLFLERL